MTQLIRGKVARVLNAQEIAMNIGTTHGVDVGMYFDVMEVREADIVDPDTEEVLGSIERPKVKVQITHAQEKLSIATILHAKESNIDILTTLTGMILPTFGTIAASLIVPTLLEASKRSLEGRKTNSVNIGDPVLQVLETDEANNGK